MSTVGTPGSLGDFPGTLGPWALICGLGFLPCRVFTANWEEQDWISLDTLACVCLIRRACVPSSVTPQQPLQAGNTNVSLSQRPSPLSSMPVSKQRSACVLWPAFQISPWNSTMKRSLLSLRVLVIFSTRDKTHQRL